MYLVALGSSPFPHTGAPTGGVAVVDAVTGAGLELSGNGSGTPNTTPNMANNMGTAVSPGTWSPQWGWYVTMTPPQVSLAIIADIMPKGSC